MHYFIVFYCQISHCYTFLFLQVFSVTLPRFHCLSWLHKLVLSAARACHVYYFGQEHLVCDVVACFLFLFCVFCNLLHFWFYAGFLGDSSSFLLFFLDAQIGSFCGQGLLCVLFGARAFGLWCCCFFLVFFWRVVILYDFSGFYGHLHALQNTCCVHIWGCFYLVFLLPPCPCIQPLPSKPSIIHLHAFTHL